MEWLSVLKTKLRFCENTWRINEAEKHKTGIPLLLSDWLVVESDEVSRDPFDIRLPFGPRGVPSQASIIPDAPENERSGWEYAFIAANSSIQSPSECFFLHSSLKSVHASLHVTKLSKTLHQF